MCLQRVLRFKFGINFAPEDKRGLKVTSSKYFRLRLLEFNLWPGEDPSKSFFLQLLKREDDSAFEKTHSTNSPKMAFTSF